MELCKDRRFNGEAYYSAGPFMIGSEYFWHRFSSPEVGNPSFSGGEVMVSYVITGESRPYQTSSGIYGYMPISRPVFRGGPGASEVVFRYSTLDLNGGTLSGGKFWKITPMVNWYMSEFYRLEFAYGYGVLDRFDLKGTTQFFQARMQFMIR